MNIFCLSQGGKFPLRKQYALDSTENYSQLCFVPEFQLDFTYWKAIKLIAEAL